MSALVVLVFYLVPQASLLTFFNYRISGRVASMGEQTDSIAGETVRLFAVLALNFSLSVASIAAARIAIAALMRWRLRIELPSAPPACLACGFGLVGIEPETDGCTVCPECGAAWRLAHHENNR